MEILDFEIKGTSPLLLHSDRLVDPLNPEAQEIKALTVKKKKTDEDLKAIAFLEWKGGLYFDKKIGVYIPAQNVHATLIEAAKNSKLGKKAKQALFVTAVDGGESIPLIHDGPKTLQALWDAGYYDARSVRVNMSKIMRYRPRFLEWSLKFRVAFTPELLNEVDVKTAVQFAGDFVGLCDYRPRFGRFELVS